MMRHLPKPTFFLVRGCLGVCVALGGFLMLHGITRLTGDSPVTREVMLRRGTRTVTVIEPPFGLTALDAAPLLLVGVTTLVAGLLVFRVVLGIQARRPFDARSAMWLRASAILIATAALAQPALSAWADIAMAERVGRTARGYGTELLWAFNGTAHWLLVAGLLGVFAQAFTEGRRLADDTAGLV